MVPDERLLPLALHFIESDLVECASSSELSSGDVGKLPTSNLESYRA